MLGFWKELLFLNAILPLYFVLFKIQNVNINKVAFLSSKVFRPQSFWAFIHMAKSYK